MGCGPWGKSWHLTLAEDPIPREARAALLCPRKGLAGFSPICLWLLQRACASKVDQGGASNIPYLMQTCRWLETSCLSVWSKWDLQKSPPAHSSALLLLCKNECRQCFTCQNFHVEPDPSAPGCMLNSYSFRFDSNSNDQKNVKGFYNSHPHPKH